MAWDLEVDLPNQPGSVASLGETLGRAGINIDGISAAGAGEEGSVHLLVEDGPAAQRVLEEAGIVVAGSTEVLTTNVEDRPGELGEIARKIADTGTNITLIYLTADGRLVLGTDNNDAAARALGL